MTACACGHFSECAIAKVALCWQDADVTYVSAEAWDHITGGDDADRPAAH